MVRDGVDGCMATLEAKTAFAAWASSNDPTGKVAASYLYGDPLGNYWTVREDRRSGNGDLLMALNAGLKEVIESGAHTGYARTAGLVGAVWPSADTCLDWRVGGYVAMGQLAPEGTLKRALDRGVLTIGVNW